MKPIVITISVVSIAAHSVTLLIEADNRGKQRDSKKVTLNEDEWFSVELTSEVRKDIVIEKVQP